jgi:2-dehydro-3-deoxyphosphogluconate aldolase / (4S)-4-hydroxy-2-oxoglutarate aldolase
MLQIIPTGGVTPENTADFLNAGAVAVGVGSSLVSQDILDNGDWPKLTKIAGKFINAVKKVKAV